MGSTIRREPISFKIPNTPDHKYLNITSFGGIHQTDNPFTADYNTASDSLNVYVDEQNSLTTRPRLTKIYSVENIPGFNEVLQTYKLEKDVLFAIKLLYTNKIELWRKIDSGELIKIENNTSSDLPECKYGVFEKDNKTYVMTSEHYYVIKEDNVLRYVSSDESTYVPVTAVGSIINNEILTLENEKPNTLTDKYRIKYRWDLWSDIQETLNNGELISNGYLKQDKLSIMTDEVLWLSKTLSDGSLLLFSNTGEYKKISFSEGKLTENDIFKLNNYAIGISSDGNKFIVPSNDNISFSVYDYDSKTYSQQIPINEDGYVLISGHTKIGHDILQQNLGHKISNDASVIFVIVGKDIPDYTFEDGWKLLRFSINRESGTYDKVEIYDSSNNEPVLVGYPNHISYSENSTCATLPSQVTDKVIFLSNLLSENPTDKTLSNYSPIITNVIQRDNFNGSYYMKTINEDKIVVINTPYISVETLSDNHTDKILVDDFMGTRFGGFFYVEHAINSDGSKMTFFNEHDRTLYGVDVENKTCYPLISFPEIKLDSFIENDPYRSYLIYGIDSSLTKLYRGVRTSILYDSKIHQDIYVDYLEKSIEAKLLIEYRDINKSLIEISDRKISEETFVFTEKQQEKWIDTHHGGYSEMLFARIRVYDDYDEYSERYVNLDESPFTWKGISCKVGHSYSRLELIAEEDEILNKNIIVTIAYIEKNRKQIKYNSVIRFQNNFWFYGNSNKIQWSENNDPTYLPEYNYTELGDDDDYITDMLLISYDTAIAFKKSNLYVVSPATIAEKNTYIFSEAKAKTGSVAPQSSIISPLRESPLYIADTGIYGIEQLENIQSTDKISVSYSEKINKKFLKEIKNNIISIARLYWTLFIIPGETSKVYVLDDRTREWFYWELPINVVSAWIDGEKIYLSSKKGIVCRFDTSDIINPYNPELTEYYDLDRKLIKWFWCSQILPLGTINYYKKLLDTTFIVADTEANDSYGLNYTFRAYRKLVSESDLTTIKNEIQYVQSVTKKTLISRFNFLQFEISNTEDDDKLNNNKLRLIGMALKYTLLGGIMR